MMCSSVRNSERYALTASGVGASGDPVFASYTPTLAMRSPLSFSSDSKRRDLKDGISFIENGLMQ